LPGIFAWKQRGFFNALIVQLSRYRRKLRLAFMDRSNLARVIVAAPLFVIAASMPFLTIYGIVLEGWSRGAFLPILTVGIPFLTSGVAILRGRFGVAIVIVVAVLITVYEMCKPQIN